MNLYELTNEYINIQNMTDDPEIDEQMILDTLESIECEIEEKADNYTRLIKQLESDNLTLEKYIDSATTKKKRKENLIKSLKERLLFAMNLIDKKEIKTELFNIKIANNGGKNPIKIANEEDVPDDYKKIVRIIDTEKIRTELENGATLPFAEMLARGQHLTIK